MTTLALQACLIATPAVADNWMREIPDNTYLATLSIPGAHDAATGSGWDGSPDFGDSYARTQELTIAELWQAGVRAFDLRPCTREGYLNINHGIISTALRFDTALQTLKDSLEANPSECAIIHLLHETDGDYVEGTYNQQLLELLQSDNFKDVLSPFQKGLRMKDVRGKILIISRDTYATTPIGGFIQNWSGSPEWTNQTKGKIVGQRSDQTATLYMQDFSDTHATGGVDTKVKALERMLTFSTTHRTYSASNIIWIMNFASAYSKVESIFGFEVSTSDGYRDNATYTHAAILNFLATHKAGATGIVMMDYAGVDESNGYGVRGKELTDSLIAFNFKYITPVSLGIREQHVGESTEATFAADGRRLSAPRPGQLIIARKRDGSVTKRLCR